MVEQENGGCGGVEKWIAVNFVFSFANSVLFLVTTEMSVGDEVYINSAFCKRYWHLKLAWGGICPMLAHAFLHLLAKTYGPLCGLSSADLWQNVCVETRIHNCIWQLSAAEWIKPVW